MCTAALFKPQPGNKGPRGGERAGACGNLESIGTVHKKDFKIFCLYNISIIMSLDPVYVRLLF